MIIHFTLIAWIAGWGKLIALPTIFSCIFTESFLPLSLPLWRPRFPPEHESKRRWKNAGRDTDPLGNDEAVHDNFPVEIEAEQVRKRENRKYDGGDGGKGFHGLSPLKFY